jgi:hypothetical protein
LDGDKFWSGYLYAKLTEPWRWTSTSREPHQTTAVNEPVLLLVIPEALFIAIGTYILVSAKNGYFHWNPLVGIAAGFLSVFLWVALLRLPVLGAVANAFISFVYFGLVASFSSKTWGLVAFIASVLVHCYVSWSGSVRSVAIKWADHLSLAVTVSIALVLAFIAKR